MNTAQLFLIIIITNIVTGIVTDNSINQQNLIHNTNLQKNFIETNAHSALKSDETGQENIDQYTTKDSAGNSVQLSYSIWQYPKYLLRGIILPFQAENNIERILTVPYALTNICFLIVSILLIYQLFFKGKTD